MLIDLVVNLCHLCTVPECETRVSGEHLEVFYIFYSAVHKGSTLMHGALKAVTAD